MTLGRCMLYVSNLHKIIKLCVDVSSMSVEEKTTFFRDLHNHFIICVLDRLEEKIPTDKRELLQSSLNTSEDPETIIKILNTSFAQYISEKELVTIMTEELEKIAKEILSTTYRVLPHNVREEISHLADNWF